jgi:hypothetical protein
MARIEQGMWLAHIKHHQEAEVMGMLSSLLSSRTL